jgi:hypothetical protein
MPDLFNSCYCKDLHFTVASYSRDPSSYRSSTTEGKDMPQLPDLFNSCYCKDLHFRVASCSGDPSSDTSVDPTHSNLSSETGYPD